MVYVLCVISAGPREYETRDVTPEFEGSRHGVCSAERKESTSADVRCTAFVREKAASVTLFL